jgi:hypothetical protein
MAAPAGAVQTYSVTGIREDLTDVIYRIAPTVTPFLNAISKGKAENTLHEWQTQDLASAASNAQVEGDQAPAATYTATVRLNNRTQISAKTVIVSGTQRSVNTAGRDDELAYQLSLKALELKRDMEFALTQNTTKVDGTATTPRQLRGLEGWIATNADYGSGGAAPSYTNNTAPTDGTARAFAESQLKNVLQQIFTQGGDPDLIMVGPSEKQTFSTFTGNSTRFKEAEDEKLMAAIDVYVSDFGSLKAVPNRFQRARTAFILQTDMWACSYLRPFQTFELAKVGDADQREILVEYTLEARQEKSSGAVRDLT